MDNKKSRFNKKYVYLVLIIMICIFALILFFIGMRVKEKKEETQRKEIEHYDKMKENINNEVSRYAYKLFPTCNSDHWIVYGVSDGQLLRSAGVEKDAFLDIDNENYCDTYSEVYCVSDNKLEVKTYIICKNHEDKGFKDRD